MASEEVWAELARAGNVASEALQLRNGCARRVTEAEHALAGAKANLEAAERALAVAQEKAKTALMAAHEDLLTHGVGSITKKN